MDLVASGVDSADQRRLPEANLVASGVGGSEAKLLDDALHLRTWARWGRGQAIGGVADRRVVGSRAGEGWGRGQAWGVVGMQARGVVDMQAREVMDMQAREVVDMQAWLRMHQQCLRMRSALARTWRDN